MGTGLVIGGKSVRIPGIDVVNFRDDPRLRLDSTDMRHRTPKEKEWIHLYVIHTTGGIPGGKDLRPQVILPGLGRSSGGGQRIVASWTHDKVRPGGAHLVTDFDGTHYCCADLLDDAAYHAERANGCSVGHEVVQGHGSAELYQGQVDAAAQLALWVCRLMPTAIQWQVPAPYIGLPISRFVDSLYNDSSPLFDVVGIVGHRDLTNRRGEGDPGNAMMEALVRAGCEVLDFATYQDLEVWKTRQHELGVWYADGIPGKQTAVALARAGHLDGIWKLVEPTRGVR
jgi:hypothetical protein